MQGKLFYLSFRGQSLQGHSGHEAPPMTHSLILTPPL